MNYKLIVCRYNEDISWVKSFDSYQIYNKGTGGDLGMSAIEVPNVGRESETYIRHIIEHYNDLEDIMMFSQGNYTSNHLNISSEEFKKRLLDINEHGYSTVTCDFGTVDGVKLTETKHKPCYEFRLGEYPCGTKLSNSEKYNLGEWWEQTTNEKYVVKNDVFWTAIFSVTRENILSRSLDSYKRIYKTLNYDKSNVEGHYMERSWFNIFNLKNYR